MLKLSILVRSKNESHLKIARSIAKLTNAEICRSIVSPSDIVLAMDSTLAYLSPLAVAKLKGSVTAAFIHDVRSISHTYLTAKDAGRRPLEQRLRRIFSLSLIKRFIDIPLSPTHAIAQLIKTYTGIDPCVVHPGVDLSMYRLTKDRGLKARGLKVILTVATKPHIVKGAVAIFRNLRTKAILLVRGPRVAKAPNVHYIPRLPEHYMPMLYSMADALLYPSLHEGFGLVVLEAMACGTPVIAFEEPALMEVAGNAALFVKPTSLKEASEVLDLALNDEALLEELRNCAIARAKTFTWERTVKELYACIQRRLAHS
jgi:glycosyltransferase involved in cell wall biosynthesis